MWRCPKCMEYNGDTLIACAKCAGGKPTFDPDETALDGVVDLNKPVPIGDNSNVQCPTCGELFKVATVRDTASRLFKKSDSALCPCCSRAVTPEALVRIAARVRESGQAVREVLLACPYCGKILGVTAP